MIDRIRARDDEYVGYGSPPKEKRFKPGNREHLKRRKKEETDLPSIARSFLEAQIPYRDGGKLKQAPRIDVYLERIQTAALRGHLGAIAQLIDLWENTKLASFKKKLIYLEPGDEKY
jgi:hypothetical protein